MTSRCDVCRSKTLTVITRWEGLRRYRIIRCLSCNVWIEEPRQLRWRLAWLTGQRGNQIALGLIGAALAAVIVILVVTV